MIIQNNDGKITIVSMAAEMLPIHEELGYELMDAPEFDVSGKKLALVDGEVVVDTAAMDKLAVDTEAKELKAAKKVLLAELTVVTESGNTFDADDQSRANMNEAITAAEVLGLTESEWKLADNSVVTVSVDEIKEALTLGIVAKGEIVLG